MAAWCTVRHAIASSPIQPTINADQPAIWPTLAASAMRCTMSRDVELSLVTAHIVHKRTTPMIRIGPLANASR